jgi:tRNA(Arg) A34 adenosine deaminase TadA
MKKEFMDAAVTLSKEGLASGLGGPFGAVVVKDGVIVGRGHNKVTGTNDPTAHAEVVAIRDACENLNTFQLTGCDLYTSCEPCPMCLGAIYWARPDRVYFANSRNDAAAIGFDDDFIYQEIPKPISERTLPMLHLPHEEALLIFNEWKMKADKTEY